VTLRVLERSRIHQATLEHSDLEHGFGAVVRMIGWWSVTASGRLS
jgi:hypothetical protein